MSKSKPTATPDTSEDVDIEVAPAEIVDLPPSTALVTKSATTLTRTEVAFDSSAFDARITAAGDAIAAVAEAHPELREAFENFAMYAAPNIEGLEGTRGALIPNANIRQAMTKEDRVPSDCKTGMYYSSQGTTIGNTIRLIVLHQHNKRVRFIKGVDTPDCTSNDAKTGSKYGVCKDCPYSRWDDNARSECSFGHGITAVTEDFSAIYHFTFVKTGSKTGKAFQRFYVPPATYSRVLELYTDKEKNNDGQEYFVPKVRPTDVKVTGARFEGAKALHMLVKAKYDASVARGEARSAGGDAGKLPADANGDFEGAI